MASEINDKFGYLSGEFNDKDVECAFRDFVFKQHKASILAYCYIALLGVVLFLVSEFFYFNFNQTFFIILFAQTIIFVSVILTIIAVRRIKSRAVFERYVFIAVVLVPLLATYIKGFRTQLDGSDFIIDIAVILAYYYFFNLPFRILLISPFLFTAGQFYLLITHAEVFHTHPFIIITYAFLISNIIGCVGSRQARIKSRQHYLKYLNEVKLRNELEVTLKRLNVLEGLVPICCHCKRIKDLEGAWEHIETFIERGSKLSFSHGICPDCFNEHYAED